MEDTVSVVGKWVLSIVATGVGFWLIIVGVIDIGKGLGGTNKRLSTALAGIGIGIVGGFFGWWGVSNILSFFKSNGDEIPL